MTTPERTPSAINEVRDGTIGWASKHGPTDPPRPDRSEWSTP